MNNDELERDIRDEDELRRLLRTPDHAEMPSFASVAARAQRRRSFVPGIVAAAAAVLFAVVALSLLGPSSAPAAPPSASPLNSGGATLPSATPATSGTPAPSGTPASSGPPAPSPTANAAVLKPAFGVIHWGARQGWDPGSAPTIRREGDAEKTVGELAGSFFNLFQGAVSPDGRRAIYSAQPDMNGPWGYYLLDGSKPAEQRRVLALPNEIAGPIVWSPDMSAIAFTAQDSGATQGVTPKYDSIRALDLASGAVRELARITDGSYYHLLGWDKASGTLAAQIDPYPNADGTKKSTYLVIGASGTKTVPVDGPSAWVASPDARTVAGLECTTGAGCSLWTWPLADYAAHVKQPLPAGLTLAIESFRPGTSDLGLLVWEVAGGPGRFALWSPAAGLRTVYEFPAGRSPAGPPFFRADGSAVIIDFGQGNEIVVDLTTGQTASLPTRVSEYGYSHAAASIRLD